MNLEGPVARPIREKLDRAFQPTRLEVTDDSHRHAGHAGTREGGESHFNLVIEAPIFQGLSRIDRQRRINAALSEELAGPVHAQSIKALAPGEG